MTASDFDQVQVNVDHLSGKVPARSTDTAADAARFILEMALRSWDGVPNMLAVDHDPKLTSVPFKEFTPRIARASSSARPSTKHQRQGRAGQRRAG